MSNMRKSSQNDLYRCAQLICEQIVADRICDAPLRCVQAESYVTHSEVSGMRVWIAHLPDASISIRTLIRERLAKRGFDCVVLDMAHHLNCIEVA